MSCRTSVALLPALLLAFCALATAGTAKTIAVYPIQKDLKYVPSICFKRSQYCCYKHEKCGEVCRPYKCIDKRVCKVKLPIIKKCIKYGKVRVCSKRCYDKFCVRFRCSPLRAVKTLKYKAPRTSFLGTKFVTKTK